MVTARTERNRSHSWIRWTTGHCGPRKQSIAMVHYWVRLDRVRHAKCIWSSLCCSWFLIPRTEWSSECRNEDGNWDVCSMYCRCFVANCTNVQMVNINTPHQDVLRVNWSMLHCAIIQNFMHYTGPCCTDKEMFLGDGSGLKKRRNTAFGTVLHCHTSWTDYIMRLVYRHNNNHHHLSAVHWRYYVSGRQERLAASPTYTWERLHTQWSVFLKIIRIIIFGLALF